jgi:hypothetical protein
MNNQKPQAIFDATAHAGVMQDKYAPERVYKASGQPVTPNTPARTGGSNFSSKHHGSNKRKTKEIASWVLPPIKARIQSMAKHQGLSESKVVAALVEKALQFDADLHYGALLRPVIENTINQTIRSETNRSANLALEAFYSAEQGRIVSIYILRFLLGEDIELLPQIIKDSQEQARENMKRYLAAKEAQN